MQVPPTIGHSNTLVVPLAAPRLVGVKRSLTVQVPGPEKPPPAAAGVEVERERRVETAARGDLGAVAGIDS